MGNCSSIHIKDKKTCSIINVQESIKASGKWRMVSAISHKTQPNLFDYDEHDFIKHKVQLDKSGKYVGTDKTVTFCPKKTEAFDERNAEFSLDVTITDEALEIKPSVAAKELWRVLRSSSQTQSKALLQEKDIIKLGNFQCFVKKIHIIENNNACNEPPPRVSSQELVYRADLASEMGDDEKENARIQEKILSVKGFEPHFIHVKMEAASPSDNKEQKMCRICLSCEQTSADPLISPCKCSGSMKWIHLDCLRRWLVNKIETVEDDIIRIYAWKDLGCELCKTPLQTDLISEEDCEIHLMDLKPQNNSFISFSSMEPDEQHKYYLFILNLDRQAEINVGRFTECDLRINEISVSRYHSKIFKQHNKVYIEDLQSKFGTLIKIPEKGITIERMQKGTFSLQMGRSFLSISNI